MVVRGIGLECWGNDWQPKGAAITEVLVRGMVHKLPVWRRRLKAMVQWVLDMAGKLRTLQDRQRAMVG